MKYRSWTGIAVLLAVGLMALSMAPAVAESRIVSVSAMADRSIAINDNGTVWEWGGPGSDGLVRGPQIAPGLTNVTAISGFGPWAAILKDDGTARAINAYPEFGQVNADGLDNVTAIAWGRPNTTTLDYGLVALKNDGTVWTWQPGNKPVRIEGLSDIIAISSSYDFSLALKRDGTVWAWGMNDNGQLGDGTYSMTTGQIRMPAGRDAPAPVANLANVTAISAGPSVSMALKSDGTVWTWGSNGGGVLGNGMPFDALSGSAVPVQVTGLDHVVKISSGDSWALALRDDGTVWAWGGNRLGTLGDGTEEDKDTPVQAKGLSDIVDVHAGGEFNLALDESGAVWAWGNDRGGVLGQRYGYRYEEGDSWQHTSTPVKVPFSEALAGPAVEPSWKAGTRPAIEADSETMPGGNISYLAAAGEDTLYAFKGDSLLSVDKNGYSRWNFTLPAGWHFGSVANVLRAGNNCFSGMETSDELIPVYAVGRDRIYIYALSWDESEMKDPTVNICYDPSNSTPVNKEVIAISRDGKREWTYPFSENVGAGDRAQIKAIGDRIYVYHCYNETVLDRDGRALFSIGSVSDPATVDENGFIYSIPAVRLNWSVYGTVISDSGIYMGFSNPAKVLEARYPNGTLYWQRDIGGNVSRIGGNMSVASARRESLIDQGNMPLYSRGTLYVPLDGGIAAYDTAGNMKWSKLFPDYYQMFWLMPMDGNGNLYFSLIPPINGTDEPQDTPLSDCKIRVLGPDGSEIAPPKSYLLNDWNDVAYDGILYVTAGVKCYVKVDHASLDPVTVTAYDLKNGTRLWNYTVSATSPRTTTITRSNVKSIFWDVAGIANIMDTPGRYGQTYASAMPTDNAVYVKYKAVNYPFPITYGVTECTYASSLVMLDRNGGLIWDRPTDSFVKEIAVYTPQPTDKANNSTVFYSTDKGEIGSVPVVEAAAGLTALASLALFVKFFLLGSVARARSRLDNNDNRKSIMALIRERPGSSLSEIAKELDINLGTVRYHLMILGLNHRISAYSDGKFVRYFINSNMYSKEDQLVISLARRESLVGLLKMLLEKDEATNVELSEALGMPDSAVSKYLGELIKKGVVVKNPSPTARGSYSIDRVHVARVANAIRIVDARIW